MFLGKSNFPTPFSRIFAGLYNVITGPWPWGSVPGKDWPITPLLPVDQFMKLVPLWATPKCFKYYDEVLCKGLMLDHLGGYDKLAAAYLGHCSRSVDDVINTYLTHFQPKGYSALIEFQQKSPWQSAEPHAMFEELMGHVDMAQSIANPNKYELPELHPSLTEGTPFDGGSRRAGWMRWLGFCCYRSVDATDDLWQELYMLYPPERDPLLEGRPNRGLVLDGVAVPTTKLYVPEAFIATPNFHIDDLWFLHILHFQYWLWFAFISLVMFYFVTFLLVVRWCNLRTKPKRETRGVSRSKCADLITATVPVSWATAIIITESVDATDYYDGFGTGEVLVAIRAYQWGWEYFYPRNVDLSYNVVPSLSTTTGRSLRYEHASESALTSADLWKFYQSRQGAVSSTSPAHFLINPTAGANKFMRFEDLGVDTLQATDAYRQIQLFMRARREGLFSDHDHIHATYNKFKKLYLEEPAELGSAHYGTRRQQGTTALLSALGPTNALLDSERTVALLRYGSLSSGRIQKSQATDYSAWGRATADAPLSGDYELQRSKGLAAAEGCALEASTYETTLRGVRGLHGVLARKEVLASGGHGECGAVRSKSYPSTPRAFTLAGLYDVRGLGDARLLSGHDFFNYLNEAELAACEGAINDGRDLAAYQPLCYRLSRAEKAGLAPALSYTQAADNFREKFIPAEWWVGLDAFLGSTRADKGSSGLTAPARTDIMPSRRGPARAAIASYNALHKVYRTRLDERRSHTRLSDFADSAALPQLLRTRLPYEDLLAKNSDSFASTQLFRADFLRSWGGSARTLTSLNTIYANLPFLRSLRSDPARYLWFDWMAQWATIEVQPSSLARYTLYGLPIPTRVFDYPQKRTWEAWRDGEDYFTRLSRARKGYLAAWARAPYLYSRLRARSLDYSADRSERLADASLVLTRDRYLLWKPLFDQPKDSVSAHITLHVPARAWGGSSDVGARRATLNTPGRAPWQPLGRPSCAYYATAVATDMVAKREYLISQYARLHGLDSEKTPKAPTYQLSTALMGTMRTPAQAPANHWASELLRRGGDTKPVFKIRGQGFMSTESLRRLQMHSLNSLLRSPKVVSSLADPASEASALKSQYRPMRKGISNMVRLHATGAVAMPIETRLHIMASSRDVIHSWAIPAAGIKIDCVPGYTSHRITIFFVHGIYWGQCMEVCGRFHHWMPIVCYFMKRDNFFLWCTHFIAYDAEAREFQTADKQLANRGRLANRTPSDWRSL